MPPSRRALLRSVAAAAALVAGCAGSERNTVESTTRRTTATPTARTTATTTDSTTTTEYAVRDSPGRAAVEFTHRSPVLDGGLVGSDADVYVQLLSSEAAADGLDFGSAEGDFPWGTLDASGFLDAVEFDRASLLVVQARVDDAIQGLAYGYGVDARSPPRVVTAVEPRRSSREFGPAVSTLLAEVSGEWSPPSVSVFRDREVKTVTVRPPSERVRETVEVLTDALARGGALPRPGGAVYARPDPALDLVGRANEAARRYVVGTDFDEQSLLAVRSRVPSPDYRQDVRTVERTGDGVRVVLVTAQVTGAPIQAELEQVLLARLPVADPDGGTVVFERVSDDQRFWVAETERDGTVDLTTNRP